MGKHHFVQQGLEVWENDGNGFTIIQLHYTADPDKRDPKVLEETRRAMPKAKWQQEYELSWDTFEGLPVYQDYDKNLHEVQDEIEPHIGLPLLLGFDFGLTPACVVAQYQEESLCVLREYTEFNMGAERFLESLCPRLRIDFPKFLDFSKDYIVFIDPSGNFRKDTDETTCADVVIAAGFDSTSPGALTWEERRKSVEHFLVRRTRRGPALKISKPNCPVLARGFQGGYRYPDKIMEREPEKIRPVKDAHSHPHDALQYIASRILFTAQEYVTNIPVASYSWNREHKGGEL